MEYKLVEREQWGAEEIPSAASLFRCFDKTHVDSFRL